MVFAPLLAWLLFAKLHQSLCLNYVKITSTQRVYKRVLAGGSAHDIPHCVSFWSVLQDTRPRIPSDEISKPPARETAGDQANERSMPEHAREDILQHRSIGSGRSRASWDVAWRLAWLTRLPCFECGQRQLVSLVEIDWT